MKKAAKSLRRAQRTRYRNVTAEAVTLLCEHINTPMALALEIQLRYGVPPHLIALKQVNPVDYASSCNFKDDYLVSRLLKKFCSQDRSSASTRATLAIEKFVQSEERCKSVRVALSSRPVLTNTVTLQAVIATARRKIDKILGSFSWDSCLPFMDFGPGATTRLTRRTSDRYYKFGGKPHVSFNCVSLAHSLFSWSHLWRYATVGEGPAGPDCFQVVQGNRITTVPKDGSIDRCIAIEPDLNMFFQKGIGGLIRSRLKKRGVCDLNDQTHNQRLALKGSIDGSLATIDLASASDGVSLTLCEELLPQDWYDAIMACRSPNGVLPSGELVTYRKVSSMGNGFTFELQSLIFWALCSAVGSLSNDDGRVSVYGDDIVCSSATSSLCIEVLAHCGFDHNVTKTFISGPFRESCGRHYFRGRDVTPFHIRENVDNLKTLFQLHNQYVLWRRSDVFNRKHFVVDDQEYAVLTRLKRLLGRPRHFIPFGFPEAGDYVGDIGFFSDGTHCNPLRWSRDGTQRWTTAVATTRSRSKSVSGYPYLLRSLNEVGNGVTRRQFASIPFGELEPCEKHMAVGWWAHGYARA